MAVKDKKGGERSNVDIVSEQAVPEGPAEGARQRDDVVTLGEPDTLGRRGKNSDDRTRSDVPRSTVGVGHRTP